MTLLEENKALLATKIAVLRRLENGLQYSFDRLPQITPASINDPAISERISAIIDRFTKLQDQLASALRHAHTMLGEKQRSFSDVVIWAVNQQIFDSEDSWLELRSLRNQLTHEYDLESDHLPELITLVRSATQVLQQALAKFSGVCRALHLLE